MGEPENTWRERIDLLKPYQVNQTLMSASGQADTKFMHCLPVRRNLELSDEIMDGENSIIYQQAKNRIFSAQVVFSEILDELK